MNPNSTPNPNLNPNLNPNPNPNANSMRPLAQAGLRQMPEKRSHLALTLILTLVILLAFGFLGWKWFVSQQAMKELQANKAAMESDLAANSADSATDKTDNEASVSKSVQDDAAMDSDMSFILNSSSEDDLRSIDQEF